MMGDLDASALVARLRSTFDAGRTRDVGWRLAQIDALLGFLEEREAEIVAAVRADLGRPVAEAVGADVAFVQSDARYVRKHLRAWLRPRRVSTPVVAQPGSSRIQLDPLGVVLVIAPWNYPVQLLLSPLVGALAAGNCAVLKHTSAMLLEHLPRYLDPDAVALVEGGVPETTALLEQRFDHIFYTGNGTVGRIVMGAAARHLTPVTLELGGKSPCYVDREVDLAVTARRICYGKFYNAGQTCIAPDYVLAHEGVHDALLDALAGTLREFYGPDPRQSPDFARIINARHHRRLAGLLAGQTVATGGEVDEAERYIAPTILRDVSPDAPVMAEEIFGPILPVLKVSGPDEAVAFVNSRPKPLAMYVFARDRRVADRVVSRTTAGGVSVNHIWMHFAVHDLPFGGVGDSGMGAYHGRRSLETFSHAKSVLRKPFSVDPPLPYPPYTEAKLKWLRRLL